MSDTPRTDEQAEHASVIGDFIGTDGRPSRNKVVLADFARTLERETAKLKARVSELERERDEAEIRTKEALKQLTKAPELPAEYETELDRCDECIKWCEDNGNDWYGINFYQGRRSGIIEGNIIEHKAKEALKAERDTLKARIAELEAEVHEVNEYRDKIQRRHERVKNSFCKTKTLLAALSERPLVVCLCGSSKWPHLHMRIMMEATLVGKIVIPMGLYGHADFPEGAKAATNDGDESTDVKQMLDRLHLAKIAMSDEVAIVRVDGIIGSSTQRELEHARALRKTIYFHDYTIDAAKKEQV